jgi:integrase
MSKRANGEGNVRQRPNGRWEGRTSYLDPVTDKRRSVSVYGATAAECRRELKKVRERIEGGQPARDAAETVGSWLARWRGSSLAASDRKPATKALYSSLSRKHLESEPFGATRLDKLRPTAIERLIVAMRAEGLSDSTVRQVFGILRLARSSPRRGWSDTARSLCAAVLCR